MRDVGSFKKKIIVIYKKVNKLPYAIMKDVYESKADTYIEQTSFPECYEFRSN